jgi:chromosome segregation ATPase
MAEFSAGFKVWADATQFQRSMADASASAKKLRSGLASIGVSLGGMFGVGAAIGFFRSTISYAQDLRDEIEKVGGKLDVATASVARLGDGFAALKGATSGFFVEWLSRWTRAGELIGTVINRVMGVTKEQEKARESAAKAAKDQEEQTKKSREINSPEKLAAAEKALQDARRKNLIETATIQERINILQAEWNKLNAEADALGANTVARKEKELEIERVTGEIRKANADQDEQVNAELAEFFKSVEDGAKRIKENEEQRVKVAAELAELAEREAAAKAKQEEITRTLKKLNDDAYADAVFFLVNSSLDKGKVQSASDNALKEVQRRKERELMGLGVGAGGVTFDDKFYQRTRIQNEIGQVKAELSLRSSIRGSVNASGIEGARRAFTGDPLVFDQLVQQFVQDSRTAADINRQNNKLLSEIRDKFKSGVPTISLTKRE